MDGGLNTFLYALGNPIRHIDPTGEAVQILGPLLAGAQAIRACLRIPACKKAVKDAIKKCKDLRCTIKRERPDHGFPQPEGGKKWCVHIRITCYIKGKGRRKIYEDQWPVGRCFDTKQTPNKKDPFPRDLP